MLLSADSAVADCCPVNCRRVATPRRETNRRRCIVLARSERPPRRLIMVVRVPGRRRNKVQHRPYIISMLVRCGHCAPNSCGGFGLSSEGNGMATAVNSVCSPVSRQKRHPNADSSHVAMRFLLPSKKHKKINKKKQKKNITGYLHV